MRFEHLVQINDPALALLEPISRDQLWNGLRRRAERPTEFVLALERCDILARRDEDDRTVLERRLDFGPFQVRDTVTLEAGGAMHTVAEATERWPRSRMSVTIEEPEPEALFLRFVYEWETGGAADESDTATRELRRQAYLSADMDTVQRIRQLAAEGLLD